MADMVRAANQQTRDARRTRKIVWLLGAGFSRPLGGPLFTDLLTTKTEHWVFAWLDGHEISERLWPKAAVAIYAAGIEGNLWTTAEECLAVLDESLIDKTKAKACAHVFGSDWNIVEANRQLSQFVAVATSYFTDSVAGMKELPEAWIPYADWMSGLTENDAIITFNYDRTVEILQSRASSSRCSSPLKMHGTVPSCDQLLDRIRQKEGVPEISMPGLQKLAASRSERSPEWSSAERHLAEATVLVVVGYSFPVSDPLAHSFFLRHSKASLVEVVLGFEGTTVAEMFGRHGARVNDTRALSQIYFAEGTARPEDGRFRLRSG